MPRRLPLTMMRSLCVISWEHSFEAAFYHRAALAETAYTKLRLIRNSRLSKQRKLHIFQTTFVPILTYGISSLSLKEAQLKRIDAFYHRFRRRILGVKASCYSRVSNQEVWDKARRPQLPGGLRGLVLHRELEHEVPYVPPPPPPPHHTLEGTKPEFLVSSSYPKPKPEALSCA